MSAVGDTSRGAEGALDRIRDNPFYVLEVRPSATRNEIERQGQKLLGMLELALKSAASYPTPVGRGERTADKVRRAMAELRDPSQRLGHELWARLEPTQAASAGEREESAPATPRRKADAPWPEAFEAMGWRAAGGGRGA